MRRTIILGAAGLPAWAAAQFIAFGMAGAGHGWLFPFVLTPLLLFLYPAVIVRAVGSGSSRRGIEIGILVFAAILDLLLLRNIAEQEQSYFLKVWDLAPLFMVIWLLLWFGWQLLAVTALLRRHAASMRT